MRRGEIGACILLAAALAPSRPAGASPAEVERTVRRALTEILAEPDAGARKKRIAECVAAVGDVPTKEIVAAVRKGPIYPEGRLPKARKRGRKTEALTTFGDTVVGYTFEHGGKTYRYAVDVPKGYDPDKAVGVLVDPGHGGGAGKSDQDKADYIPFWRRTIDEAGHADWLVARTEIIEVTGPDAKKPWKPLPEDEIAEIFDAFFRDLFSRFHVDPDRVYVSGLSQTGFWAWFLGAFRADRFAGIAPMSAVTWEVDPVPGNLTTVPMFVLHGDADPICKVAQPRGMVKKLEALRLDVRYKEVAGGGHDGSVWSNLPEGLKWLADKPRARHPAHVVKAVRNRQGPWAHWIRIDGVEKEVDGEAHVAPVARVEGKIEGQTVRITSEHVKALTVCLSSEAVDLTKPVEVVWNGKSELEGTVTPSLATLLSIAGEKVDWSAVYEASVPLK
jgi:poly(3-hydroxybutyrate) depolymerase